MGTPPRSPNGTVCVWVLRADPKAQRLEVGDDPLARLEPVEAAVGRGRVVVDARPLVEDADRVETVAAPDLEIVEVVGRRDLHRAAALFGVGVFVGHDRDAAADQRQDRPFADEVPVTLVVGMDPRPPCRPAWSRAGWSRP